LPGQKKTDEKITRVIEGFERLKEIKEEVSVSMGINLIKSVIAGLGF
jgi:hypothetical protein